MEGSIYLLIEREFLKSGEKIYKIGKTKQEGLKRFGQYPKGSELLLYIKTLDCDEDEKKLKKRLEDKYKCRRDIGTEYYEGDVNDIKNNILKYYNEKWEKENIDINDEKYKNGKEIGFQYDENKGLGLEFVCYENDLIYGYYIKSLNSSLKICSVCMLDEKKYGYIWHKVEIKCSHVMHTRCYRKWCDYKKKPNCPICGDMNEEDYYCDSCDEYGHIRDDIVKCNKYKKYIKNLLIDKNNDLFYYDIKDIKYILNEILLEDKNLYDNIIEFIKKE